MKETDIELRIECHQRQVSNEFDKLAKCVFQLEAFTINHVLGNTGNLCDSGRYPAERFYERLKGCVRLGVERDPNCAKFNNFASLRIKSRRLQVQNDKVLWQQGRKVPWL